jgi:hypothetical protein
MRSFWSEPFLWIHLAGLTAVPIFLGICFLGLTAGEPILPIWLEIFLVAVVGITPVLGMQILRPFYIFSILALAIKPEQLNEQQRRLLSQFKTKVNRVVAVLAAVFMLLVLIQIYDATPAVASFAPFLPQSHNLGLMLACVAFLLGNLFLQIPVSVALVVLTDEAKLAATEPYEVERISQDFTIPGWRVNRILPSMVEE